MSEQKVLVDNQLAYGTFSPSEKNQKLINLMRRLPKNWLGKRLMFTLRRRALKQMGDCADIDLFDANMRLYTSGNVSEKRALFAPQFFDLEEREALQAMASDNAVFIDIGANVGLYSFLNVCAVEKLFRSISVPMSVCIASPRHRHSRIFKAAALSQSSRILKPSSA